ncbi:MAG: hypothetical protein ACLFVT_09040, partial [Syntrophobacteria bacterium]
LIPGDPTEASTWQNIAPDIAMAARARLNELHRSTRNKFQKRAYDQVLDRLRPPIDRAFRTSPDAADPLKLADRYLAASADRIDSTVMKTIRRRLENYPSGVLGMVTGRTNHVDNLLELKRFFLSKEAEKELASKGLTESTGIGLKEYNDAILQPLRHSVLSEAFDPESGQLLGSKLANVLDRYDSQ